MDYPNGRQVKDKLCDCMGAILYQIDEEISAQEMERTKQDVAFILGEADNPEPTQKLTPEERMKKNGFSVGKLGKQGGKNNARKTD